MPATPKTIHGEAKRRRSRRVTVSSFGRSGGTERFWYNAAGILGLLGGMMEFPSTPWRATAWTIAETMPLAPVVARWSSVPGIVCHTFTHFQLELTLLGGSVRDGAEVDGGSWCAPEDFARLALPTLMKKVARLALAARGQPSLALVSPSDAARRTSRASIHSS